MDLTKGTLKQKNERAKKMMLWFGIVSLIMSFGGLTSSFRYAFYIRGNPAMVDAAGSS
jgi:hypothetical protein